MNYTALCKYYRAYIKSTREGKILGHESGKSFTVNAVGSAPHRFMRSILISIYWYNQLQSFKYS